MVAARPSSWSFYEAESGSIVAYLLSLTGSTPVAQDLAQEAFTRAYRESPATESVRARGGG